MNNFLFSHLPNLNKEFYTLSIFKSHIINQIYSLLYLNIMNSESIKSIRSLIT